MSDLPKLTLHSYWAATAPYRVRIALNLKGVEYAVAPRDLRKGAQHDPAFTRLGIQELVPVLEGPKTPLIQSLAIIEWLEERVPAPPLLPADPDDRAIVRAMAGIIACDMHPLNNLRVLNALKHDFAADKAALSAWTARWINDGFSALERLVAQHGLGFCFGDTPTMADCCLVPQVYSAERFGVDLTPFPSVAAAARVARDHLAFAAAHPNLQADAAAAKA